MKLSVVTTMYRSEATIAEFIRRASAAAGAITSDYEIVVVDDGSPDRSLDIATAIARDDPHVKVVELARNFGHHKALMTGLQHASGDYCFLIDSDLEEAPELIERFWATLHETGNDVVYGMQQHRAGNLLRRFTGYIAYRIFNWLIPYGIPSNHLTVRLMRRNYVDSLLLHRETQLIIGGLWVITGYRQQGMFVDKKDKGSTSYSIGRRWKAMLDSVTNFSEAPLIGIFYTGLFISFISALLGVFALGRWVMGGPTPAGWLSVMLSLWFLVGLAILFIGIIGIYLAKVFIETKNRPFTIVRAVHTSRSGLEDVQ